MTVLRSPDGARLWVSIRNPARPDAVVLLLHGGSEQSTVKSRGWHPAILRMVPIGRVVRRRLPGVVVARLGYAVAGWNDNGTEVLRDARWALARLRQRFPGSPLVLLGHSLGGRVALQAGGDPDVRGVVGLAPWAVATDPAAQLAGRRIEVLHGDRDEEVPETSERDFVSAAMEAGAIVHKQILPGLGHTMVKGFWVWHRLAAEAVRRVISA